MARERGEDVGGPGADVLLVPGDAGGPGRRAPDVLSRPGPLAPPRLLGAQGAAAGGEPVLQQIPAENPAAAQVSEDRRQRASKVSL